jgi:predicted Zn-dependent peptidase
MSASVTVLNQGLTLIHQEIPHISTVTIDVWLEAGAGMEREGNRGVAHFVEHMVFKGTDRVKPGDFDRLVESLGSVSSAATSYDYTRYSLTTPKDHFPKVLPYLSDLILYAAIPTAEMEKERQVVLAELSQAWSDPDWISYQFLLETIFRDHPYGSPVMGSADHICSLQVEDLRAFHQEYYQTKAVTIVVVGALPQNEVIDLVAGVFAHRPRSAPACPYFPVPELEGVRREQISLPALTHDRLFLAWLFPKATTMAESIGMEILSLILAEGRSARLHSKLKDWVRQISSGFIAHQWAGFFTVTADLQGEYLEPVEYRILDEVSLLATNPPDPQELKRAQKSLSHRFAFMMESPSELAHFLGFHALLGVYDFCHHWQTAYPNLVYQITPEDLTSLAQTYLKTDRYVSINVSPLQN